MTNKFERKYLIEAACRIATGFPARSVVAQELSRWLEEQDFGFAWAPETDFMPRRGLPDPVWHDLRARLAASADGMARARPDALERNIAALTAHLGLSADERAIFALAVRAAREGPLKGLCSVLIDAGRLPVEEAVKYLSGLSLQRVRKALAGNGRLMTSGLLAFDQPPLSGLGLLPTGRILTALEPPSRGLPDILEKLFAPVSPPSADWEDFDHLGPARDFALKLLRGAIERREKGVNILFHGAPGTGKSAFARYLAQRLGMPVLERRASDLLDRYVGSSERNIARAFVEARDRGAFLVFDEADSLLNSRRGASHRWEVTQVNEMLTWMESHPLPFACTTNLADRLDEAAARRFDLRITFLPLGRAQLEACFRRFFEAAPPSGLHALDRLTPGDFAVVARRTRLLGITEPDAILGELEREQATKPGARRPVGFKLAG